jgi:hypothetical protein
MPVQTQHRFNVAELNEQSVEVYRKPHFAGYSSKTVLQAADEAVPSAFADAVLKVAELFKR